MYDIDFETDISVLLKHEESNKITPLTLNIKSAEGCYVVDEEGKRYLDLTSNKECNPLGYSSMSKIENGYLFDSELFRTTDSIELENLLKSLTGLNKAVFTSSKPESYAIYNTLIKAYSKSLSKTKILVSCLSEKRDNYQIENITTDYIPLNNDIIAQSLLTKSVAAVIVDIVQVGEDINIANTEYLTILRNLCNKYGALLILDTGTVSPLRTLKGLLNYDSDAIKPDVLILSSSAAQGIPFGAVLLSDKLDGMNSSGSTIFAYKSAISFINECTKPETLEIIKNNAAYLEKSLNNLATRYITIADIISYGMLFTLVMDISAYDFAEESLKRGIIIEAINSRTLKLSPPYNIGKEEVDRLMFCFEEVLNKLARYDRLM